MTVVFDIMELPGSQPAELRRVNVYLVASLTDSAAGGDIIGEDVSIFDRQTDLTNAAGYIQFDLRPNSEIDPAGSYYIWDAHLSDGQVWRRLIGVPDSGGPYNVNDLVGVAPPPLPGPADLEVQYAAPWGDDAFDGLSWSSPKETVLAAFDALGTGGVIYIADQTPIGGESAGQGLWFQKSTYGALLPGWRNQKQVVFQGVSSTKRNQQREGGKSAIIGATTVGIWHAGCDQGIEYRDIEVGGYVPEPILVGRAPDGSAGTLEDSSFGFIRCKAQVAGSATRRNAIRIEGNSTARAFWGKIRGGSYQGNVNGTTFEERAAISMEFTYSIDVTETVLVFYGGLYYLASNSTIDVVIDGLQSESQTAGDPLIRCDGGGTGHLGWVSIDHVSQYDPADPITNAVVEVVNTTARWVRVGDVLAGGGSPPSPVSGPHMRVGTSNISYSTSMYRHGGMGLDFNSRYLEGEHDAGRRLFGLHCVPLTNLATTVPGSWGTRTHGNYHTGGNATVTTGKLAPNGTLEAAELSFGTASQYGAREFYNGTQTLAVGDHIVCGAWIRSTVATSVGAPQFALYLLTAGFTGNAFATPDDPQKQWRYVKMMATVTAIGTNPCTVNFSLEAYNGEPLEVWNPMLLLLPTATYSDEEAHRIFQHLGVYPKSAAQGAAYLPGGSPMGMIEQSDPAAPPTNHALFYAKDNGAGKTQLVARFPTGAVQVIATEP